MRYNETLAGFGEQSSSSKQFLFITEWALLNFFKTIFAPAVSRIRAGRQEIWHSHEPKTSGNKARPNKAQPLVSAPTFGLIFGLSDAVWAHFKLEKTQDSPCFHKGC